jgi:hypothetical protein
LKDGKPKQKSHIKIENHPKEKPKRLGNKLTIKLRIKK